ncbi:hypothetical protein MSAN_01924600 [Mycena sanguinolenta]|uniref:Uncharacterized protein n=1 Tax=Mycena sanguinolenta TaxID=230812 RepID=A0A8H6XQ51_9AGAR|nr:hypothetical protein MSAN_01924600 [Mycena sanguinolenta]
MSPTFIDPRLFPTSPTIISPDAQTVPPPPPIPYPERLYYGWILDLSFFGLSPTPLSFSDDSGSIPKRPTTLMEASSTFSFVPTPTASAFAYMAEVSESLGAVKSVLDDADKIPSVDNLQKLEAVLDLRTKPHWFPIRYRTTEEAEALHKKMMDALPDIYFPFGRQYLVSKRSG